MRHLPEETGDSNVLVGVEHSDDGSVYKLTDDIALVQTVDFFTPIVDDPYMFGQVAAANSLSDVYAMGGEPKTVLNIVAYPIERLGPEVLAKILQGSHDKVKEAGAVVAGGHSIDDAEPKFGLSVTGTVHPDSYYTNIGARPGDVLVLTKPIGVGILTTALKKDLLRAEEIVQVTDIMRTLNKYAAQSLAPYQPHAVTDVTGFGLLGHAYEMASGSDVSVVIEHKNVPILAGAKKFAEEGIVPGGSKANHEWLANDVTYGIDVTETDELILCDAITSGGLLISMPQTEADSFIKDFKEEHGMTACVIGEVVAKKDKSIYVS